jgi:hypothetical protein
MCPILRLAPLHPPPDILYLTSKIDDRLRDRSIPRNPPYGQNIPFDLVTVLRSLLDRLGDDLRSSQEPADVDGAEVLDRDGGG